MTENVIRWFGAIPVKIGGGLHDHRQCHRIYINAQEQGTYAEKTRVTDTIMFPYNKWRLPYVQGNVAVPTF